MSEQQPPEAASGFVCPRCGGALWEHLERAGTEFACRIGDTFSALELWVEHCDARNRAVRTAARALAENAALAHRLSTWARERGNEPLALRLDEEAVSDARYFEQVQAMLDGLTDQDGTETA